MPSTPAASSPSRFSSSSTAPVSPRDAAIGERSTGRRCTGLTVSTRELNCARKRASPVGRLDFKSGKGRQAALDGFDSHSLPPAPPPHPDPLPREREGSAKREGEG